MSNLAQKVRNIVTRHQGAYISGSGKRTIEDQIKYVKQRPSQYPRTLRAAFAAFGIERVEDGRRGIPQNRLFR